MSNEPAAGYGGYHQEASSGRPGASRVDTRAVGFIGALLVLVGLCGILYVGQASRVHVLRRSLEEQRRERVKYYSENAYLRSGIARAGASENLPVWTRELGYAVIGDPHYVFFSYAPLPDRDAREESFVSEGDPSLSDEGTEQGLAERLSHWGEDVLDQFRDWIDLAAIKAREAR